MEPTTVHFDTRVEEAWVEHHERLWRALLVWSGSADLASDAVAEAFAQVLRRGDAVRDVGRWVWRAAFRIAGGLLAARADDAALAVVRDVGVAGSDLADVTALALAVGELDERDRTVVVLCLVGGWSAPAVADLTDSSAGAVRVRLHRARRTLRRMLEDDDA